MPALAKVPNTPYMFLCMALVLVRPSAPCLAPLYPRAWSSLARCVAAWPGCLLLGLIWNTRFSFSNLAFLVKLN